MRVSLLKIAREADEFFMNRSPIHDTMRRLTRVLDEMKIPFAVAGAMAVNARGHRRTTAELDVLIRRDDLDRFQVAHIGADWGQRPSASKNFRDTANNVNVDTLIVGQYPGDGLPKPIAFPEPESVSARDEEGIPYVSLDTLLELKIASGMTADHRPRDLDDVIQLIRVNQLPENHADQLNPWVAEKYRELWKAAQVDEDY